MRLAIAAMTATLLGHALPAPAQTALKLTWELRGDEFADARDRGASRAAFTLTNRDTRPLPPAGWAIYFNTLLGPRPGSEVGGVVIEQVVGELYRLRPAGSFPGLAPGKTATFEYLTGLLGNITQAPAGPYIVYDAAPGRGHAIADYTVVPFERPDQRGRDPRLVTPAARYERNEAVGDVPPEQLPLVLPTPISVRRADGVLHLAGVPALSAGPGLAAEAAFASSFLSRRLGGTTDQGRALVLEVGTVRDQPSPEAYELVVDGASIRITGNSRAGVFYGLQSLRSLLPVTAPNPAGLDLPLVRIVDAPRFAYRGLHLDVARNFQPKGSVLRVLDLMARYKLNALHFHITDDEGWRIEIPGLPELTSVGARRGHTLDSAECLPPAYGSGPDVDRPFGSGYFSRADYVEIVKYAAARHIEVVPEIEMPGHARAAIKAMEARFRRLLAAGDAAGAAQYRLADPDDQSVYASAQDFHDNVMNPAVPSTYTFIEKVVDEMVALHRDAGVPLRHLHVGGDEVPAGVWERSPVAQAYLREHRLSSVDDLWFVFYGRVETILARHGLPMAGWEEMGVRKTTLDGRNVLIPNPGFAGRGWRTYVWNNVPGWGAEDLAYRLANGGYEVVLSPVSNTYLDMAYTKNPEEPGLFWGGFVDVDKPFDFIPFDYYRNTKEDARGNPLPASVFVGKDRLTEYGRQHIAGIEACLWSETLRVDGRLDYMLMPKLLGHAERAWAPDPDWAQERDAATSAALHAAAWSRFANTVGRRELPRLDQEGWQIGYRIPPPGLKVVDGAVRANLQLPGFTLRYTTDGSEPTTTSPEVSGPISATGRIRVAAFDGRGRKSATATIEHR